MVFASSLLAVSPASATIINLTVNPGIGLDVARTCIGSSCLLSGGQVWLNNSNYATTGTITIDDSLMTLSATLNVAFSEITGAADNGITELEFYNTTYTITNAPVTLFGGTFTITGGNWATVDPGTLTQVGAGGGSTDPIFSAVRVTGSCGSLPNGQCGFTFGRVNFQVGAPLNRYVEQTFNLAVVPEPTTITLIGAGILGLGWAGRRRA
jgi:hypothetical protein